MTINYIIKDVTTVTGGVVVHGCNCQGVMGSGVALAIRKKWPIVFDRYKQLCDIAQDRVMLLGTAHFILIEHNSDEVPLYVGNIFTQLSFGKDGKRYASIEDVDVGLMTAGKFAKLMKLPLYMPRIGCGLGGLDWESEVRPLVEILEEVLDIDIFVCDLDVSARV